MTARGPLIDGTVAGPDTPLEPEPAPQVARPIPTPEGGVSLEGPPLTLDGGVPPLPQGIPPLPNEGMPLAQVADLNAQHRSRVMAAMTMHFGGEQYGMLGPDELDPLVDRFMEVAYQYPQLFGMLDDDLDTVLALSDDDIARRMARGESMFGQSAPVMDSVAEVFYAAGATAAYQQYLTARTDTLKGDYENLLNETGDELREVVTGLYGHAGVGGDGDTIKAQSFTNALLHQPGMWVVDPATNRLLVSINGRHGEQLDWEVQLDKGVRVNNTLDALSNLIQAEMGSANTMLRGAENLEDQEAKVGPSAIGLVFDTLTNIFNKAGDSSESDRNITTMTHEAAGSRFGYLGMLPPTSNLDDATQAADAQLAHFSLPEEYKVGIAAAALKENPQIKQLGFGGGELLDLAQQIVDENPDKMDADIKASLRDDVIADQVAALEDRGAFGRTVDKTAQGLMGMMTGWDDFTNWIGVEAVEAITVGSTRGMFSDEDPTEGFNRFKEAFTVHWDRPDDHLSEFFGIDPDSDWADVTDFVASVVFDPTNYIFGGGKFTSELFQQALTDPHLAGIMLHSRPMRAVVNGIASDNVDAAVRTVFATDNLTYGAYRRLLDLALDPQSTRAAVREVFKAELPSTEGIGFFLGQGLDNAIPAQAASGWAHTLSSWDKLPEPAQDAMFNAFTVASRSRTLGLADTEFMGSFLGDVLVPTFHDDTEKMIRWGTEAIDAVDPTRQGELGSIIAQKQSARTSLNQANYAADAFDLDAIPELDGSMRQVREALANVETLVPDETLRPAVVQQLEETYKNMGSRRVALQAVEADLGAQGKQARRQLNKVDAMEHQAKRPETRAERVQVVVRMYDEIAQDLNLPVRPGAINPITGGPVYEWERVTGASRMQHQQELELAYAPFGTDPEDLKNLHASGFLNRMASMPLPASPYEIIAYKAMGGGTEAHASFLNRVRLSKARKITSGFKTVWAFNLLFNPVSALRAHIDEPLRFLAETGDLGATAQLFRPGSTDQPFTAAHVRGQDIFKDREGYTMIANPYKRAGRRSFLDAVDRWLNGSILNDDMFQRYAREILTGQPHLMGAAGAAPERVSSEWSAWWNETGWTNRRKTGIKRTAAGGEFVPMNDVESFNTMHRAFEYWLKNGVDDGYRDKMRQRVLEAAVQPGGKLSRTADAELMLGIRKVPGVDSSESNIFKQVFDAMWGAPARRRGSVFFDNYFEEAMGIYTRAYERKGLLLTEAKLAELAGVAPNDAAWMLRQGMEHPVISRMVTENGAVTQQMLEAHAARYAAKRADSLMYQMTAASFAGRGAENIGLGFPFARAHMDFVRWWGKHMFKNPRLRVPLAARSMPVVGQAIRGVERVPINARAMAKWAHITEITNNDNEDSIIDRAIDDLTFFPTNWSGDILADLIPTPGPFPSWLIDSYMDDEEAQEIVNTIWPNLAYTAGGTDLDDIPDYLFPNSSKSMKRMGGAGWRFLSSIGVLPNSEGNLPGLATGKNIISEALQVDSMPAGAIDQLRAGFGEFLGANALTSVPHSDWWNAQVDAMTKEELSKANRREALSDFENIINPMSKPWEPDNLALQTFAGFMDESELLVGYGVWDADDLVKVDPATGEPTKDGSGVPAIQWAWGEYEAGRLDAEGRENLEDTLADQFFGRAQDVEISDGVTLRDWIIFQHPEVAINLASSTKLSDRAPVDFARKWGLPDGRIKSFGQGPEADKRYSEAWAHGWIEHRPPDEMFYDADARVYSSTQRVIDAAWRTVTGLEWQNSTANYPSEGGRVTVYREHRDKRVDWSSHSAEKAMFEHAGITVKDGMTYQELHDSVDFVRDGWQFESQIQMNKIQESGAVAELSRHDDPFGDGLVENLRDHMKDMESEGYSYITDWPEEKRAAVREAFRTAVNKGFLGAGSYKRDLEYYFGPLDYEPPVPPPVDSPEITQSIRFTSKEVSMGDVAVYDGDNLGIVAEDGNISVRLIGINAPDNGDPDYTEATKRLNALIQGADEVRLVQWRAEDFGATTTPSPTGEQRLLMWLYVDGVPIYDPTVFAADNTRGAAIGGTLLDYAAIYAAGR